MSLLNAKQSAGNFFDSQLDASGGERMCMREKVKFNMHFSRRENINKNHFVCDENLMNEQQPRIVCDAISFSPDLLLHAATKDEPIRFRKKKTIRSATKWVRIR